AEILKPSVMRLPRFLIMLTNQHREHGRKKHKHERLDETYQQFHKIKRNRQQPAEMRHEPRHLFEHFLASENISIEPEAQGYRPEENGKHFQKPDHEKDDNHQCFEETCRLAFRRKQMKKETHRPNLLDSPDKPAAEKYQRHSQSHVEV